MKRALIGLLGAGLFTAASVWAAQPGWIDVDSSQLREGPGKRFKTVETLKRGTPLAISNFPTEGYYKVRTTTGLVGWISGDALLLEKSNPKEAEKRKAAIQKPETKETEAAPAPSAETAPAPSAEVPDDPTAAPPPANLQMNSP